MTVTYVAYVDEAGDEGFGKLRQQQISGQSRWLLIGAAIVSIENDRFMPLWRDEIMALFPNKQRRDLHFRYLSHEQKVAACSLLAEKPIGVCVVASNKETILDSPRLPVFKQKGYLYNYLVRYLLERVTETCARAAARDGRFARLQVVFSRRSGTDYQSMKDYLSLMKDGQEVVNPARSICWDVFDPEDIRVENHSIRAGLQIADVLTSATSSALDPNLYGNVEPRYSLILKSKFITKNGQIINCGLTLIPPIGKCPLTQEQKEFIHLIQK
jgi:Protein of unknown function (DUF3800)